MKYVRSRAVDWVPCGFGTWSHLTLGGDLVYSRGTWGHWTQQSMTWSSLGTQSSPCRSFPAHQPGLGLIDKSTGVGEEFVIVVFSTFLPHADIAIVLHFYREKEVGRSYSLVDREV